MSAIHREPALSPGLTGVAPAFDFYEQAECVAPAPALYEMWRLQDLLPVDGMFWYSKPTMEMVRASSYEEAQYKVDWSRDFTCLHEECKSRGREIWMCKRPWWA